jgi:hypothetical protein
MEQQISPETGETWKVVVEAAGDVGGSVADSLRVQLWLEAHKPIGNCIRPGLWSLAAGLRNITSRPLTLPSVTLDGKIIFCVPYGTPSNIGNIGPVMAEASRRGMIGAVIIGRIDPDSIREFTGEIPIYSCRQLLASATWSERVAALRKGRFILNSFIEVLDGCYPALSRKIRSDFLTWLNESVSSGLLGKVLYRFLGSCGGGLILSTSDFFPLESQLCLQGARFGIPSAIIQHGLVDYHWWPFSADFDLLWGELFKKEIVALGAPEKRLFACGMVASDKLFGHTQVLEKSRKSSAPLRCLILSNTNGESLEPSVYAKFGELLKQALSLSKMIHWTVKLHPIESDAFYRRLGTGVMSKLEILPKSVSLQEAVLRSDAVCTVNSAAGLEAMIMRRPLLVFDVLNSVRKYAWWPIYGGGRYANSPGDVVEILDNFRTNVQYGQEYMDMQEAFLKRAIANPGRAAMAVLDFAEHILH